MPNVSEEERDKAFDARQLSVELHKDRGGRVSYDDDADAYVLYQRDVSYPLTFSRDRGGAELCLAPNVSEEECDKALDIRQLSEDLYLCE